jgi:hypothetical protein
VHAFIAEDCQKCHAVAFERVRDQECLECHGGIKAHTPPGMEVARLDQTRCAECHIEHGGTYGLAALEQELCADCHSKLDEHAPKTKVRTVTDFKDEHPEFRLSVPTENFLRRPLSVDEQPRGDSFDWVRGVDRFELSDDLREHSGVRFNHVRHVAQEEKKDGSGRLLNCGDCHQMDAAGKNMMPINFEDHCQSCHSIGFDPRYEREAIHGDPVRMREDLRVFYEAQELDNLEQRIRMGQVMRARVGSTEEQEQRAAARKNADARVRRADGFLMDEQKPGACANCHEVKPGKAADGGYDVEPVRLLDVWMPKSLFQHETHDPFPCRDCHPAAAVYDEDLAAELEGEEAPTGRAGIRRSPGTQVRRRPDWSVAGAGRPYVLYTPDELMRERQLKPSEEAVDILIPSIEKCQGCHAGAYASKPKVASECVLCHPFHRDEFDRMRKIDAQQTTSGPEIDWSNGAG